MFWWLLSLKNTWYSSMNSSPGVTIKPSEGKKRMEQRDKSYKGNRLERKVVLYLESCLKQKYGNQSNDGSSHIYTRHHSLISTFLPVLFRPGLEIDLEIAFQVFALNQSCHASWKLSAILDLSEETRFFFLSLQHSIGLHGWGEVKTGNQSRILCYGEANQFFKVLWY